MCAAENGATSYGASTIVVAVVEDGTDILGVANLGDSGFMILRKGPDGMEIIEQSQEQQHKWNTPFQLTRVPPLPPALVQQLKLNMANLDTTDKCDTYRHTIREGDLILLFSDGFRDNLWDNEILKIVDCALSPIFGALVGLAEHATPPERVAHALALAARERGLDGNADVPFNVEARRLFPDYQVGGKLDDVVVIAAWVVVADKRNAPCLGVDPQGC